MGHYQLAHGTIFSYDIVPCSFLILPVAIGLWYDTDGDVQAVTAMVQQAMQYIDEAPTVEARIELIETLNTVSAGKVLFSSLFVFVVHICLVVYCCMCCFSVRSIYAD